MQMSAGTGRKRVQGSFSLHLELFDVFVCKTRQIDPMSITQCCVLLSFLFTFSKLLLSRIVSIADKRTIL